MAEIWNHLLLNQLLWCDCTLGRPPTPRAISSVRDPVEITSTCTCWLRPSHMTDSLPYCLVTCAIAACSNWCFLSSHSTITWCLQSSGWDSACCCFCRPFPATKKLNADLQLEMFETEYTMSCKQSHSSSAKSIEFTSKKQEEEEEHSWIEDDTINPVKCEETEKKEEKSPTYLSLCLCWNQQHC